MANRQHNERLLETLQPGDRIKFTRPGGVYYHCGIYIGDSTAVHLGLAGENIRDSFCLDSFCSPSGVIKSKAVVREDNIFDIVGGGVAYRDNILDRCSKPFPPKEVVERAKNKLGRTGYNLLTSNCEHFATWCRYGKSESEQVENIKSALQSIRPELSETEKDILLLSLSLSAGSATYSYFAHAKEDTDYYPRSKCSSEYQAASCRVGTDETKPKPECKRKTKTSDQEVADRITHEVMEFRFQRLWYIPMDIVRNFWQGFKDYMFRTSSHDHKPAPEAPPAANYEEVNCIYESFCLADSQSVWSNSTARNECSPPASPCYTLDSCTPICYPFQCTPIQYTPIQCPPIPHIPIQCTPIQCTPMNYSTSSPCAGLLN